MRSVFATRAFGAILSLTILLTAAGAMAQEQAPEDSSAPARKAHSLFPKDAAGLNEMAEQAIAEGNGLRLLQTSILLRKQQPYELSHMVNMVRAYAMMDKPNSAYNYMLKMQQQGLNFDFNTLDETAGLRSTEVYAYLNDLMVRAGDPAGEAEAAFNIDDSYASPAAIAWDPSRERFIVGTSRDGLLISVSDTGKIETLLKSDPKNGPWAIEDLAVDPERNRLWLTSTSTPEYSAYGNENSGQSGLFAFELDSLKPAGRFLVNQEDGPHELGAVAVDQQGNVYAADRRTALLYRKQSDSDLLAPFLADSELTGFSDMAIAANGNRIYLADRYKGILAIDPEHEKAVMLEVPDTLNLGGIEGLFHADHELFIVQSGIEPMRLMALQLDTTGGKVENVRPMAIALESFKHPSGGTLRGDSIYYFADAASAAENVTVLKTALSAGASIVAPDMRKFEEETLSKARNN